MGSDAPEADGTAHFEDHIEASLWYAAARMESLTPRSAERTFVGAFEGAVNSWMAKFRVMGEVPHAE